MKNGRNHVRIVRGWLIAALAAIAPAHHGFGQTELAKVTHTGGGSGDNLGFSVSIDGDVAVAGAWHEDISLASGDAGAVYVSRRIGGMWGGPVQIVAKKPGGALDRAAGDTFGRSVAVSGSVIVVGSPNDTEGVISSGSAYVYRFNGSVWVPEAKLLSTDRANSDKFGDAVAIDGNTIVVTAGSADLVSKPDAGAAYVFTYNGIGWSQAQKLTATPSDSNHNFGTSASISGDTIVIGEHLGGPLNVGTVNNPGAAYVFRNTGVWTQEARLTAFDGGAGDQFGISVSNSGNTAVVGSRFNDTAPNSDSGAAYVFSRSGSSWSLQAKLTDAAAFDDNDNFGTSVALRNSTLVVGAPGKFSGTGAAYVFTRTGVMWTEAGLYVPDLVFGTAPKVGGAIALSTDLTAIAGAAGESEVDTAAGAAYIFDANLGGGGADSDGDGLSDDDEINIYHTDPNNPDTDGDGLSDGVEVSLAAGGPCPNPLDPDSDHDGLSDGYENSFGPNMCNADSDGDGLSDGAEVNIYHTNPAVADTDGDGLSDGAEVNIYHTNPLVADSDHDGLSDLVEVNMGTNPNNPDSDGDGLTDGLEIAFGTNPLNPDTDGDGLTDYQEVTIAGGSGCPNPLVADSDGDGLLDGLEYNAGLNPCDADTDHDGLSDSAERNIYHTNPLVADTDHDGLLDGMEVALAAGSGCPDPLNPDSDGDGILDGDELTAGLHPCGVDSDNDGLSDGQELIFGTNPLNPDTDGDGLLDGTEVDIAHGTGCPNPLVADSDGDTLSDGYELSHNLNPCDADTDGDGIPDNIDPLPRNPGVTPTFLVAMANSIADEVRDLDPNLFLGPNNNDKKSRQKDVAKKLDEAAKELLHNHFDPALDKLTDVAKKIDGLAPPADWMGNTPQRAALYAELLELMTLVDLMTPPHGHH